MTDTLPLITAIVPVYNGERYFKEALESIFTQQYEPLELLVLDDGSTDGTADIARSYGERILYHYQPNRGLAAARNAGIELASGRYIAFLDADDLWPLGRLRVQMQAFLENPGVRIVSGMVRQFVSPDLDKEARSRMVVTEGLQPGQVLPACLYDCKVFEEVGDFDTQWTLGADLDWTMRLKEAGFRIHVLPDLVLLKTAPPA